MRQVGKKKKNKVNKNDKRVWRGQQREIARSYLYDHIKDFLVFLTDSPADKIRAIELKSIREMIKRRRKAQRQS